MAAGPSPGVPGNPPDPSKNGLCSAINDRLFSHAQHDASATEPLPFFRQFTSVVADRILTHMEQSLWFGSNGVGFRLVVDSDQLDGAP